MAKKAKYRPYPPEGACPCGSDLTYSDCCKSKAFKYELDLQGNVVRSVGIPDELVLLLQKQEADFKKEFGRSPQGHDRLFFGSYRKSPEQFSDGFKDAALASGLDRAKVYATWKTGLVPTAESLNLFTDLELQEWHDAADEFCELERRGVDPFDNSPDFSKKDNDSFVELVKLIGRAPLILASILNRGVSVRLVPASFFQLLFASQALAFLKKYCAAMGLDEFDGGIDLCRSVYEAYLRIAYLRHSPQSAEIFVALASVGSGAYEFKKKGDRTNFNVMIERSSGRSIPVDVSNYKMAEASGNQTDLDVYTALFRYMSGFVHPNVDGINKNFSPKEGFSIHFESNPFDGLIVSSFVTMLLFSEISQLGCIRAIQRRDARFLAKKLARRLKSLGTHSIHVFPGQFSSLRAKVDEIVLQP